MASSLNASNFREFEDTGHVAVVVAVTETYVRVAEQNFRDVSWRGRDYSRQLSVEVDTAAFVASTGAE
jgi:hypothetical protein